MKSGQVVRGLATVALLKTNYDRGADHIGMFMPFIVDALSSVQQNPFSIDDVRLCVLERHGLEIPAHTLQTLLSRAGKQGMVTRGAGLFSRISEKIPTSTLVNDRDVLAREHNHLAEALQEFSAKRNLPLATAEDALAVMWDFLERNHVAMLVENQLDEPESEVNLPTSYQRLVAQFLADAFLKRPDIAAIVQRMLEGYVLQNTLLLRDISAAKRRFRDLTAYIDTGILMSAFGYQGEATHLATLEGFKLLRDTGARLAVFAATLGEVRRILRAYEDHLGTDQGRKSLYQTSVTRFFLTKHFTPSDIRMEISLIEQNTKNLGFAVEPFPPHDARYTLNEKALAEILTSSGGTGVDRRVKHDVDAVAAVLTLRRGVTYTSLDDARAVFVSSSGLPIRNISKWYRDEGQQGIPPAIHELALSNAAWLKRPAATKLKLTQLVALCGAALKPSRAVWQAFLKHLDELQKSGKLSSDEAMAIVASELTDHVLSEVEVEHGEDWQPTPETLGDVVGRVQALYNAESDAQINAARTAQKESEERIAALRGRLSLLADGIGTFASWFAFGIVAVVLVTGVVLNLKDGSHGFYRPSAAHWMAIVLYSMLGLFGALFGFNAWHMRLKVKNYVARIARRYLLD